MVTTLNDIRSLNPEGCGAYSIAKVLEISGKAGDEPIQLSEILENFGLLDALWCLQSKTGIDKELRLFAVEVVEMFGFPEEGTKRAIAIAKKFANGKATLTELKHAYISIDDIGSHTCDPESIYAALTTAKRIAESVANALTHGGECEDEEWHELYARQLKKQEDIFIKFFG